MNRRRFIQSLGIGVAALALRFRPESVPTVDIYAEGEWGMYRYTISRCFKPVHDLPVPILIKRCSTP